MVMAFNLLGICLRQVISLEKGGRINYFHPPKPTINRLLSRLIKIQKALNVFYVSRRNKHVDLS